MQLLTPSGYVNIDNVNIGDSLVAYDVYTGEQIINHLEAKTLWTPNMMPEEGVEAHYDIDGSWVDYLLISSSYEVFQRIHGDWKFYRINGTWDLYKDQSIWANLNVIHVSELQIGDVIYNDLDQDIIVTSIEEVEQPSWWKLDVSGDSSYIADGLSLHNASRFWVGGGSSANWNATANTNWSATSAGANNASVPTSADDVTFNGSGSTANTNSTISATITILSYTVTSAYTATSTHNAVLTVAGNITLSTAYTIAGSSGLTISATSTFTSGGKTWPNALTLSSATTTTLSGNLTVGGLVTVSAAATVNRTSTERLNCDGGLAVNNTLAGTAEVYLQGGTWSGTNTTGISNSLFINGNITVSGTVYYRTGTLTYTSGTVTVTGSTLRLTANCTLNTSTMPWNDVSIFLGTVYTLTSNLTINGLLSVNVGGGTSINSTTSEVINCFGGFNIGNNLGGTAPIVAKAGTLISNGFQALIGKPLTIDGDVTISGNFTFNNSTLTYLSGSVITQGSTLLIGNSTINAAGITWNNVTFSDVITLASDIIVNGLATNVNGIQINRTTNEILYLNGGLNIGAFFVRGNGTIYLQGGTWTQTAIRNLECNTVINGDITFGNNCAFGVATLTYRSGLISSGSLNIVSNCTGSSLNKVPLERVVITNGVTMLLDQFFIGTPEKPATITASTAAGQYNIRFTDDFEKISQDVNVSGCVLARPLQLLLSNTKKLNTIKTTNVGIRYTNSSPNGFPKNTRKTPRALDIRGLGLSSDPNFVEQT